MAVLEREHSQGANWKGVDALLFSPKSVPTQVSPQIGPSRTICGMYASNLHFYLLLKDHMAHLSVINFDNDEAREKFQVCNYIGPI